MESISQMYNCTPTRPRVFCWGTRQQLAVPNPLCLCLFAATRRSKIAVCLCPCATWSEYPSVSRCNNWPFQNNPVYNPTVCVCLFSLVRIPLCLCLIYPCVSLQQLSVPKQPCLQPHCLCLFATTSRSKTTLSTTPLSVSVFAAWSEYPCVCVSDTLVSRCNNSAFQSNPVYNPTVCVSLQLGPNTRCNNWLFQNNPVYNPPVCVSLQLGPSTPLSVSKIPLCLVATTDHSKATLSTTPLSVSLCSLLRITLCLCPIATSDRSKATLSTTPLSVSRCSLVRVPRGPDGRAPGGGSELRAPPGQPGAGWGGQLAPRDGAPPPDVQHVLLARASLAREEHAALLGRQRHEPVRRERQPAHPPGRHGLPPVRRDVQ